LIANKPNQRIIATARNPEDLSYLPDDNVNVLKLALDVTSVESVSAAFVAARKQFGESFHLDVVVNNAGYSLSGDTEGATEEEMHKEMETLFFGTVRVTTRSIEVMRQAKDRRGGLIFQISSLAGVCAFPGHAFYHASKFAVEGFSESVAREMHPDWNSKLYILSYTSGFFYPLLMVYSQFLYRRAKWRKNKLRGSQQSKHHPSSCLYRCRYAGEEA
jgi:NAD(P)-dependent dehydrogenase (short-subunit alcohol dehydrogenase family)